MPDPNKHAALRARGFKIQPTCSTCCHWGPTSPPWGSCPLMVYVHDKHTEVKQAGVPDIGYCDDYAPDLRSIELSVGDDYAARYVEADDV